MPYPVVDLHCDLLCHLSGAPGASPEDRESRCGLPQLRAGGVTHQVTALYAQTEPGSAAEGEAQLEWLRSLPDLRPGQVHLYGTPGGSDSIELIPAIENASTVCAEHEPLSVLGPRLTRIVETVGTPLYMSLTWASQNRFGGGNLQSGGLSDDGRYALALMGELGIALDLSHASDVLAFDALEYIDARNLPVRVLASHSVFRHLVDHPRNLPDSLAREIAARKGLIGLNFLWKFLGGGGTERFLAHLRHGIEQGWSEALCFGADFYPEHALPPKDIPTFAEDLADASCYPNLIEAIRSQLGLHDDSITALAGGRALRFIERER